MAYGHLPGDSAARIIMSYAIPRSIEEQLDVEIERAAVLIVVLRRVAWAFHRTHENGSGITWSNCTDALCHKAHEAIEGRLVLGPPGKTSGIINSVVSCHIKEE